MPAKLSLEVDFKWVLLLLKQFNLINFFKAIKRTNEKCQSRAAKVQKFIILKRDFSIANGELGPTLKLRRPIVHKMYLEEINQVYDDKNTDD